MTGKKPKTRAGIDAAEAVRRVRAIVEFLDMDVPGVIEACELMEAANRIVPPVFKSREFDAAEAYGILQASLAMKMTVDLARLFDFSRAHGAKPRAEQDTASIPVLASLLKVGGVRDALLPGSGCDAVAFDSCVAAITHIAGAIDDPANSAHGALARIVDIRNKRLGHLLFDKSVDALPRYADLFLLVDMAAEATQNALLVTRGLNSDFAEKRRRLRAVSDLFIAWSTDGLKRGQDALDAERAAKRKTRRATRDAQPPRGPGDAMCRRDGKNSLVHVLTVAEVRALLDPPPGEAPAEDPAESVAGRAMIDDAASELLSRNGLQPLRRGQFRKNWTPLALALDRPAGPERLRAIVSRAYARADVYADLFHRREAEARRAEKISVLLPAKLEEIEDLAGEAITLMTNQQWWDEEQLEHEKCAFIWAVRRFNAAVAPLSRLGAMARERGQIAAAPEVFFVLRLAEAFAAITGYRPSLNYTDDAKHGRVTWAFQQMVDGALRVVGLAAEGRSADGLLKHLASGFAPATIHGRPTGKVDARAKVIAKNNVLIVLNSAAQLHAYSDSRDISHEDQPLNSEGFLLDLPAARRLGDPPETIEELYGPLGRGREGRPPD